MERLPYIDEHSTGVDAPRERVWTALTEVLRRDTGRGVRLARVLGCDPVRGTPELDGRPGQALPGFRVVEADPGRLLALRGQHRFSRYSLTFLLEARAPDDPTALGGAAKPEVHDDWARLRDPRRRSSAGRALHS